MRRTSRRRRRIAKPALKCGNDARFTCVFRRSRDTDFSVVRRTQFRSGKTWRFLRAVLRAFEQCAANIFSTCANGHSGKIFACASWPQPQRNPVVRASRAMNVEKLFNQVENAPLTGVLAGVKSATRSRVTTTSTWVCRRRKKWVARTVYRGAAWVEFVVRCDDSSCEWRSSPAGLFSSSRRVSPRAWRHQNAAGSSS